MKQRGGDRRRIERRAAKRGVTIRIGDKDGADDSKRVRRGQMERQKK